ncbi:NAD(P)-dependent dehydrogenase (short-subunit alcohol dehydrogenase family) [Streptomyces sp. 3211.6]|uniref:SDR family NAD(P)-dependent oxidoreductase n=1 Tax=Streptomyces TaxID=1883 RepID=UPI0009A4E5A9|nr:MULTISPECIES: glucose 1-dehydrogenase [Streptomyces]RKT03096.1 NAD(P)-dependent dehydrogenase (short-subunit alcohol dehydrogenase family) [Streptomyces sp. 3211.6]RPF29483.1 NAD(P)-dependent dehydrogenase (short-subunit alcohol dehydrogenase family) [Streptomyces sp. Ag109_G2-6]
MERRPVTLVTGGSRGIGAAACVRLAAEGHDLVLGYARDEEAAEAVAERVRAAGARCLTVRGDTSREEEVERLFDVARAELGPVTGLVNNAGVTGPLGRLADARTEDLRRVVEVNLLGYLLCCRRAARDMAEGGGAIVNVSSAAATLGSPGDYVHYAATKAAVDALTVGLSKELGPDRIRVNAVAPGIIETDMHAAMGDPDRPARAAATIPLGRPGRPEEVAGAIAWLLSADASYTTGAVLRVSGGR